MQTHTHTHKHHTTRSFGRTRVQQQTCINVHVLTQQIIKKTPETKTMADKLPCTRAVSTPCKTVSYKLERVELDAYLNFFLCHKCHETLLPRAPIVVVKCRHKSDCRGASFSALRLELHPPTMPKHKKRIKKCSFIFYNLFFLILFICG